jgi:hypothetical protein
MLRSGNSHFKYPIASSTGCQLVFFYFKAYICDNPTKFEQTVIALPLAYQYPEKFYSYTPFSQFIFLYPDYMSNQMVKLAIP